MDVKKRYVTNTETRSAVSSIVRQIINSKFVPDVIVGISRGGLVPAVMISHFFNVKLVCLHVSTRDHADSSESNLWLPEDALEGKNILIVDDINDTGATLNWIKNDWEASINQNLPWGNNIKVATIFDNESSRSDLPVDYCYEEINKAVEDVWIIFPYEEWWDHRTF